MTKDLEVWIKYSTIIKHRVKCDIVPYVWGKRNLDVVKKNNDICIASHDVRYNHKDTFYISNHTKQERKNIVFKNKIDLHGCKVADVYDIMQDFCTKCIMRGEREIIVITGKGSGKIRSATENWINDNKTLVIKYSRVRDCYNQCGCFYVWLRKNGIIKK